MTALTAEGISQARQPVSKTQSIWHDVPMEQWNDWRWQMRHRITTAEEMARVIPMTPVEQRTIERALERFRFAVPPYYASLIDSDDPACPIRLQAVPGEGELLVGDFDIEDPLNEDGDAVAPGMTHRYPDRVLWVVMHECAMLCRHCTRKRKVGGGPTAITDSQLDAGIAYLRSHPEIRDVLLSGGDPFLLSDEKIEHILKRIRTEVTTVEVIRFGTRFPVTMPQR
ncbi:MAG: 4Fe-4S cluster-binding domain-containing protein, partial [Thermoanaerobaculales bacterium]|nr:4Fe-4S cluster-binding domain-containing protein [Thermoanaerobaculales bacterium]